MGFRERGEAGVEVYERGKQGTAQGGSSKMKESWDSFQPSLQKFIVATSIKTA